MTNTRERPVNAIAEAQLAAASLSSGKGIDQWSLGVAIGTLIGLALHSHSPHLYHTLLGAGLVAACIQKFYALRTSLDAEAFAFWSHCWHRSNDPIEVDLAAFDVALARQFKLKDKPHKANTRTLQDRIEGAQRLLKHQILALVAQILLLISALLLR